MDTVSSTVEISELKVEAQVQSRQLNTDGLISKDIANAMGISYTEEDNVRLVLGGELADYDIAILSDKSEAELEEIYKGLSNLDEARLKDYTVVDMTTDIDTDIDVDDSYTLVTKKPLKSYNEPSEAGTVVDEYKQNIKVTVTSVEKDGFILLDNGAFDEWIKKDLLCTEKEYIKTLQGNALLDISNPDVNYTGKSVSLSASDRDLLERLVMGEAGAEGYEGAALVAQCIRDTLVYKGYDSVEAVRQGCKYSGSIDKKPNQNVKDAVAFIFDDGGYAVKHKIFYFYAYKWCKSSWHETQTLIVQHGGHRFFY